MPLREFTYCIFTTLASRHVTCDRFILNRRWFINSSPSVTKKKIGLQGQKCIQNVECPQTMPDTKSCRKLGLEHAFQPATLLFTVVSPFVLCLRRQSFSIFTNHESSKKFIAEMAAPSASPARCGDRCSEFRYCRSSGIRFWLQPPWYPCKCFVKFGPFAPYHDSGTSQTVLQANWSCS